MRFCALTKTLKKPKETTLFTIASKRIKYLAVTVPEEVKDLCAENRKTLIKETEDDTYKWEELILLKCPCCPEQSTDLVTFLSKFQWPFSQK